MMFRTFAVRLGDLKKALDLAGEFVTNAGYQPNTREQSIVQWKEEKDPDHTCEICFRSYVGSYWSGYIEVYACDCDERWAFKEIVSIFREELSRRGWLETFQRHIFQSTGTP